MGSPDSRELCLHAQQVAVHKTCVIEIAEQLNCDYQDYSFYVLSGHVYVDCSDWGMRDLKII